MRSLTFSVVICVYADDRWIELLAAITSVRQQTMPAKDVIVVVDHNVPLLERIRREIPDVVAIENHEARGLSGARNSGLAMATGEIVAFLDDDAVAEPDWLARFTAHYANPRVAGVGGAVVPVWDGQRPVWFPEEFDWVVGCTYRGLPDRAAPVRNLIGANMSFRRQIFETVGGFRSGIGRVGTRPVGCEETELCIRVIQRMPGMVFRYEPEARIFHRVPSHRATWGYYCRRCHAEGRSKSLISQFVGSTDSLASERTYTFVTLPRAIARESRATVLGDWTGMARAGAIVAGLTITTAGYLAGQVMVWSAVAPRPAFPALPGTSSQYWAGILKRRRGHVERRQ